MNWPCQFCSLIFNDIKICVYHEILICPNNPKFKYRKQTLLKDIQDKLY